MLPVYKYISFSVTRFLCTPVAFPFNSYDMFFIIHLLDKYVWFFLGWRREEARDKVGLQTSLITPPEGVVFIMSIVKLNISYNIYDSSFCFLE